MVDSCRLVLHRKCLQDLSALCELFENVSNLPRAPAIFKPLSRGSSTVHRASKHNGSRGTFTFKTDWPEEQAVSNVAYQQQRY